MLGKLSQISQERNKKINKIEKIKPLRTPKDAMRKLKEYAVLGYDSIDAEEKAVFFKYFGIFDKEKPNGKDHFMLRIRIPGGQMTSLQAVKVGEVAKEYGKNYIDITTRMQIQLRYLKIRDLPTVLDELQSVGITTYQTGIDNLRNIVTDPLDGVGFDNLITVMPLIDKMQEFFLKKDEWIGTLPRKFNTSISANYANRCNVFAHDCCFSLALKDGIYGFNVHLGGRVGMLAQNANVFLKEDEVIPFFETLITIFKEYGFRDNRNKNRLHFFIKEVGLENLVEIIRQKSALKFGSAGQCLVELEHFDTTQGRVLLKDGTYALHVVVPAGIFDGDSMAEVGEIAKIYGGEIRLSVDQNLYIVGLKSDDIENVLTWEVFEKYKNINSPFFNDLISCPGSHTCSFGVIAGKVDAIELSKYLSDVVKMDSGKVRIYWSACIKGCGIHELGDIGLLGCKAKIAGGIVPGVDILIGGKLTNESREAKTVIKAVPLLYAKYYIEELVFEYKRLKKANESFLKFSDRVLVNYSLQAISFMMSFNYLVSKKYNQPHLKIKLEVNPKTSAYEDAEVSSFGANILEKIENSVDEEIVFIVDNMLEDNLKKSKVFLPFLDKINQF